VSVLCLSITLVTIQAVMAHVCLAALTATLPSTTLLADTILLRVFMFHTVPHINFVWGYRLSFGFLNPEDRNSRLS